MNDCGFCFGFCFSVFVCKFLYFGFCFLVSNHSQLLFRRISGSTVFFTVLSWTRKGGDQHEWLLVFTSTGQGDSCTEPGVLHDISDDSWVEAGVLLVITGDSWDEVGEIAPLWHTTCLCVCFMDNQKWMTSQEGPFVFRVSILIGGKEPKRGFWDS